MADTSPYRRIIHFNISIGIGQDCHCHSSQPSVIHSIWHRHICNLGFLFLTCSLEPLIYIDQYTYWYPVMPTNQTRMTILLKDSKTDLFPVSAAQTGSPFPTWGKHTHSFQQLTNKCEHNSLLPKAKALRTFPPVSLHLSVLPRSDALKLGQPAGGLCLFLFIKDSWTRPLNRKGSTQSHNTTAWIVSI